MRRRLGSRALRRRTVVAAWSLCALLIGGACTGEEAAPPGPPAPTVAAPAVTAASPDAQVAEADVPANVVEAAIAAPGEAASPGADAAPSPAPETAAVAEPAAAEAVAADEETPPPRPTEEACRDACDNALALTMRELPADAADVRAAVLRALQDECPKTCAERGTPEGVACIARAKSPSELVECPP